MEVDTDTPDGVQEINSGPCDEEASPEFVAKPVAKSSDYDQLGPEKEGVDDPQLTINNRDSEVKENISTDSPAGTESVNGDNNKEVDEKTILNDQQVIDTGSVVNLPHVEKPEELKSKSTQLEESVKISELETVEFPSTKKVTEDQIIQSNEEQNEQFEDTESSPNQETLTTLENLVEPISPANGELSSEKEEDFEDDEPDADGKEDKEELKEKKPTPVITIQPVSRGMSFMSH